MDGWGPVVRGAGSPGGVSARVLSSCRAQAPRPPLPLQPGIRLSSAPSHVQRGWSCTTSHSHQVPFLWGIVSLGKSATRVPGRRAPRSCSAKGVGGGTRASRAGGNAGGEAGGGSRSTKTCKLHPQDFATCESVYFIGWRWKNKAPAEAVEQNPPQQPLAGSCQLPFLWHSSAWDPAHRRSAAPSSSSSPL